jgi:hypothetical protein
LVEIALKISRLKTIKSAFARIQLHVKDEVFKAEYWWAFSGKNAWKWPSDNDFYFLSENRLG